MIFVIDKMRSKYRQKRSTAEKGKINDMAALVKLRKMPAGGLTEVQTLLLARFHEIKALRKQQLTTEDIHYEVIGISVAALYVYAPQGRIKSIASITLEETIALFNDQSCLKSDFKTGSKYGYQPVLAVPVCLEIIRFYLDNIRPIAEAMHPSLVDNQSPLFASRRTGGLVGLGRQLKRAFERICGLTMTSNSLRTLMTTHCYDMFKDGSISERERDSVDQVNGHTSIVAKKFYQQRDREDDTKCCLRVASIISPQDTNDGNGVMETSC